MKLQNIENKVLRLVSLEKAEKEFYLKKDIFTKIGGNQAVVFDLKSDIYFPFSNDDGKGVKLYIESAFDENALIVTQFKNVQRFFQEEIGINCKSCEKVKLADVKEKVVYGTLPLAYASQCNELNTLLVNLKESDFDSISYEEFKEKVMAMKKYQVNSTLVARFKEPTPKETEKKNIVEKPKTTRTRKVKEEKRNG